VSKTARDTCTYRRLPLPLASSLTIRTIITSCCWFPVIQEVRCTVTHGYPSRLVPSTFSQCTHRLSWKAGCHSAGQAWPQKPATDPWLLPPLHLFSETRSQYSFSVAWALRLSPSLFALIFTVRRVVILSPNSKFKDRRLSAVGDRFASTSCVEMEHASVAVSLTRLWILSHGVCSIKIWSNATTYPFNWLESPREQN
jgi:hypothetical protein